MIVAIHQPNYLPWAGYFYKMARADCFVLFDNAQYPKGSFANRNRIKTASGVQMLTVPVRISRGHRQLMNEIEVAMEHKWPLKHWATLKNCYHRAAFFKRYESALEVIYKQRHWASLAELNEALIMVLREALGIVTPVIRASTLGIQGKVSNLSICLKLKASGYLSGEGAEGYQDEDEFRRHGIVVTYTNFRHPASYPQLYGDFVSHLAIVDLLFNCGPESMAIIYQSQGISNPAALEKAPLTD
jgi:hypothetical protein